MALLPSLQRHVSLRQGQAQAWGPADHCAAASSDSMPPGQADPAHESQALPSLPGRWLPQLGAGSGPARVLNCSPWLWAGILASHPAVCWAEAAWWHVSWGLRVLGQAMERSLGFPSLL